MSICHRFIFLIFGDTNILFSKIHFHASTKWNEGNAPNSTIELIKRCDKIGGGPSENRILRTKRPVTIGGNARAHRYPFGE